MGKGVGYLLAADEPEHRRVSVKMRSVFRVFRVLIYALLLALAHGEDHTHREVKPPSRVTVSHPAGGSGVVNVTVEVKGNALTLSTGTATVTGDAVVVATGNALASATD
jgi:hypothetical protein